MKKTRKGFTIVELVIVIAVIAVLTAILVPTFIHLTKKANEAADHSLVTNLNKALAMREAEEGDKGKNMTMHDCVVDLKKEGYSLPQLATRSGEDLVWSQKANRFFLGGDYEAKAEEYGEKYNCWHIYEQMPATQEWGIYPNEDKWPAADKNLSVSKVGFDAGRVQTIEKVTYTGDANLKVTLRTNGGTLIVNDTNNTSEQKFYGYADSVEVSTGSSCFTAHGTIGTMDLKVGKAVADSGAFVGLIKAAANTVAEEKNGGVFVIPLDVEAEEIKGDVSGAGYTVSGGTITPSEEKAALVEKMAEEIAEKAANDEDNTAVALIETKKYASLKDAVEAAKEDQKIRLVKDFTLSEDIGELTDQGFVNGLRNEVVLAKDIKITFDGAKQIQFNQGGKINVNGHKLNLVASTKNAGLFLVEIASDEELQQEIGESSATLTIKHNLNYISSNTLENFVKYNGTKWEKSSQIGGGAEPVVGPGDNPIWDLL